MKVLKFGGTSVANSSSLKAVINILQNQTEIVVVVSAFGGITDMLVQMMNKAAEGKKTYTELLPQFRERHMEPILEMIPNKEQNEVIHFLDENMQTLETLLDAIYRLKEITSKSIANISSFGEILSSNLIYQILSFNNLDVSLNDSRELITTYRKNNRDIVDYNATVQQIKNRWKSNTSNIFLTPGFIASNKKGETTTLGRGGSDFTAAIYAKALGANILEIWTDVSGIFTANPKIVSQAVPINHLSYYEAMELSHFGAKIIYPPTMQPLVEEKIPLVVKNTFTSSAKGTLIDLNTSSSKGQIVKGISHIDHIALLSLEGSGMIGIPGFSKRLFEALSEKNINIIMITQASSEHSICLGLMERDVDEAKEAIDEKFAFEISLNKVAPALIEKDMVNIAVVGDNMRNHQGISGKLFSSLGKNNINIRAISQGASERNISFIINKKDVQKALNTLHERFFEDQTKELNLFVMGVGNVGSKLLEQIKQQQDYLRENLLLKVKVIGISNSRKMILTEQPINLNSWEDQLNTNGVKADKDEFFNHIKQLNLRNSIFIDNTANEDIAKEYVRYLNNSIGVTTCNKIACADQLENYLELKRISRKYRSPFMFETNVGAGLPIIDTLNNLIASGDQIIKIQAVLSGSLNFVFNNFKKGTPFHDIVLEAQKEGYTEPDPKIDLSGIDVARKILILARESGLHIELEEIENESFLPESCLNTRTNDDFFKSLKEHGKYFDALLAKAEKNNCRLKYVAQLENGKAKVGLQQISPDHDFYHLEGSDNIILFYTNRYKEQPLIVKGAGAGAAVTASGIFADIIRIGKQ